MSGRSFPWLRRPVATCLCGAPAAGGAMRGSRTATRRRRNMLRRGRRSHGFAVALLRAAGEFQNQIASHRTGGRP